MGSESREIRDSPRAVYLSACQYISLSDHHDPLPGGDSNDLVHMSTCESIASEI